MSGLVRRGLVWAGRGLCVLFAGSGFYFLGADIVRSLSQNTLSLKPFGQIWYDIDAGSLNLSQAVIERYVSPGLWASVFAPMLNWPAWVLPLILAAVLAWFTWPRRRG